MHIVRIVRGVRQCGRSPGCSLTLKHNLISDGYDLSVSGDGVQIGDYQQKDCTKKARADSPLINYSHYLFSIRFAV
jgi:hypothetical protein